MRLLFSFLSSYFILILCQNDVPSLKDVPLVYETQESISCPDPNAFSCNNILLDFNILKTKEYVKILEEDLGYIMLKRKLHWQAKKVDLLEFVVLDENGLETDGYWVTTVNEMLRAYYGFLQYKHLKMNIISKVSELHNGYLQRWTQVLPHNHTLPEPSSEEDDQILPQNSDFL